VGFPTVWKVWREDPSSCSERRIEEERRLLSVRAGCDSIAYDQKSPCSSYALPAPFVVAVAADAAAAASDIPIAAAAAAAV